jgi:exodeoxyribonuclease VII small subunit
MATFQSPRDPGEPSDPLVGATDFEQSMTALEAIVEQLEQGKLSLDEVLAQFERGVHLSRACQAALRVAEQRVEILLRKSQFSDELEVVPFAPNQARDDAE